MIAARGDKDARVYILYGDGTGGFPLSVNFPVSGSDGYIAAADIDRDGYVDVAVSRDDNTVQVLWNRGNRAKNKDCIGVWRPSTGQFLLDRNGNNRWDGPADGDTLTAPFGLPTDIPVTYSIYTMCA